MKYEVLKKFSAEKPLNPGDVIEAEGKNVQALVDQRYLRPVDVAPVKAASKPVGADVSPEPAPAPAKRRRGRPKGSKNQGFPDLTTGFTTGNKE